jgi:cold shock CspA family protein
MYAGVISDVDPQGGFGLIVSDEGEIVLFGRESLQTNCDPHALRVGQRVEFTIDKVDPAPHANAVTPQRQ